MGILAAGKLAGPDYFILVGYFVLMLGIGAYFYRYMKGMKDYFSGNNKIPWWLSGVSFYMSGFSAFAFIAYSELAFKYGLVALNIWWFGIPALVLSIVLLAQKWRRMRIDSPVEYLENRYSPLIRQVFAWQGLPVRMIDDALKLVAMGMFLSKAFNINLVQAMLFSGLVMLAYTMMGGLWAVVVTDFIQFVVMAAAIIVLVPLSVREAGGLATFFNAAPEGFFNMTHPKYDWFYIVSLILLMFLTYSSVNWGLIQRYYCVPKESDVYKLGILVVALEVVGPPLILLPAMAARHFMPDADAANIYSLLCLRLLPVGMIGLVIAAMFSATMSMLSGDYNAAASVLTNDIYKRVIHSKASQRELVFVGRVMTSVVGFVAIGIAFYMIKSGSNSGGDNLFRNMMKLFSVATAPVAVPMLFGILSKRINNKAAIAGFSCGIVTGLLILFLVSDEVDILGKMIKCENIILWATTAVTTAAMLIVSYLFPSGKEEIERVEHFLVRLGTPIGQLAEDNKADVPGTKVFSPFVIVGVSIIFIAILMAVILPYIKEQQVAFNVNLVLVIGLLILGGAMIYYNKGRKD
ncbi:MAG TPA: hypothetical protein PLP05_04000 [Sedimentisphaerales bacterium]|nr:hypothetical protein [Sedimentisphaerales bacterium]